MYHFTVIIANPPLGITRHFSCVDREQADQFEGWLKAQHLTYKVTYTKPHLAEDAILLVEWEQQLAKKNLVV